MYSYRFLSSFIVSCLPLLLFGVMAQAGNPGIFTGTVTEKITGEPLPLVIVHFNNHEHQVRTNERGFFSIKEIPEGCYSVFISSPGYKTHNIENLVISSGHTTNLSISLAEDSLSGEDVVIDHDRTLTQQDYAISMNIYKGREFRTWPVPDYQSVLNFDAGHTLYTPSRNLTQHIDNMYIRGGQPYHSILTIDGIENKNVFSGHSEIVVNSNTIEEIVVITGNGNAEYGPYQSGVIQVKTKNPTNRYSGHVEYITDFVAPAFLSYSYGYQNGSFGFGGPLIPGYNKIKFYVSAEGQIFDDAEPSVFGFPKYAADSTGRYGNVYYSYGLDYNNIKDWSRDTVKIAGWDPVNGIYNTQYKKGARPKTMNGDGCNSLKYGNLYGKLIYDVTERIKITFNGHFGQTTRRIFIPEKTFNIDHVTRLEKKYYQWGGMLSYQADDNSTLDFGGHVYYSRSREMDDRFGWNINWSLDRIGNPYRFSLRQMSIFESPGQGNTTFRQNEISTVSLKSSYVRQISKNNQFKAGIDYSFHTIRMMDMDMSELFFHPSYSADNLVGYRVGYIMPTPTKPKGHFYIKNQNKDYYDRDTWRGRDPLDGARHPFSAGLYIQDRYSDKDYSLWLGMGYYIFNSDAKQIKDPYNPLGTPGVDPIFQIGPEDFKKPKTFIRSIPRAGASARIFNEEIFIRLNTGLYVQQPPFQKMYVSANALEQMVTQPPATMVIGNPNLEPEESFQFELGGNATIANILNLDLSCYYKHIYNPIGIKQIRTNPDGGYYSLWSYSNSGSANVYGLSFEGLLKRTFHIQYRFLVNYQLARDHGSGDPSGFRSAWLEYKDFTYYRDSYYDQFIKCSSILDIRSGKKEGFKIGNYYPLENTGINIYATFSTGFPYTPTSPASIAMGDNSGRVIGRSNSERRPIYFRNDIKIDKTFELSNSISLQVYMLVLNVYNRKNPIDVYTSSGKANDDGYRATAQGQALVEQIGPEYNEQYNIRMKNGLFYDTPRQVRLGFLMNF